MRKLGLIAGGGSLPASLARHCLAAGRPLFVLRLKGFSGAELAEFDGLEIGITDVGGAFSALRAAQCGAVCFAGTVKRPDFLDLTLPDAGRAAHQGDDGLLRFLVQKLENEGFSVEGAHQVMADLTLPVGPLGRVLPTQADLADIARALDVARSIGRLDVGQGAVSCDGLVLAVEAQEGTDAMLQRVAGLPEAIRGVDARRRGVLVKASKPGQETRVDLPTIGPRTLEFAARAGLRGIAGEAGRLLIVERARTETLADELGLFVFGIDADVP
ncbi:MAG TPA: UDP-2,3-diacylglucosamine diphosphatase LpxI [Caulobacteraceae bacterium]